jgi:broad specificity phosphatase PhoE
MAVTIIFEAHGTTLDNENNISSGLFNIELSPLGKKQAGRLGERYKKQKFDAIFCSTLKRSYDCAEIAFGNRELPIIKDPRLCECDYGKLTKHPSEEVEPNRGEYITKPFPGGESYEDTAKRIKSFLKDLYKNYDSKKVMIIGHRATQYGLDHWIKKIPLRQAVTAPWQWQPGWVYKLNKI